MGTIAEKLAYLVESQNRLKTALADKGVSIDDSTPYRSYSDKVTDEVSLITDTFTLVTEDGQEVLAVEVEDEVVFTATANDIRAGTVAATADGVVTGTKEIPAYHTTEGTVRIPAGNSLRISMYSDKCQYTKLQALVCAYNTCLDDSVATEKVSINGKVYAVNSTSVLSEVSVDTENQAIELNLTNDSDNPVVIRYMTYKEEE